MGLSSHTAYSKMTRCKSRLMELYTEAKRRKATHDWILEERTRTIFETSDWKPLPIHSKEYLRGYSDARMEGLYRYELEWRMWIEFTEEQMSYRNNVDNLILFQELNIRFPHKNLFTREQIRELQAVDPDLYKNIHSQVDGSKSAYCWKGYPDKLFYAGTTAKPREEALVGTGVEKFKHIRLCDAGFREQECARKLLYWNKFPPEITYQDLLDHAVYDASADCILITIKSVALSFKVDSA